MKRTIVVIFCLFCILFLFLFFNTKQDNIITVKFSSWGSQSETEVVKNAIAEFEKQNPDIKIDFIHIPQNYFQKIHLLFASGLEPDVIFMNNQNIKLYSSSNLLEDISPYFKEEEKSFYITALDCFKQGNSLYAIPRDISNLVIYYNKDIAKSLGVKIPQKIDDIKELKDKLSSLEKEKQSRVKKTSSLADTVILSDKDINAISAIFNIKLNFNLLYRASKDGKDYNDYKTKVGSHKNLLIIGKTNDNLVLGGYTINNLEGNGFIKDKYAFLYNFKTEKKFQISKEDEALNLKEGKFPCFGNDDITFGPGEQKSKFPNSYKGDNLELTGGKADIKFDDIEIFYLSTAE